MSEIGENIILRKDTGEELDILQKYVGFKARQDGILTINFRCPKEEIEAVTSFFQKFNFTEPLTYDIGNTGEVPCYYKGIAPLLEQKDNSGFPYFFLSVTLQEIKEEVEEEPPNCGCGF